MCLCLTTTAIGARLLVYTFDYGHEKVRFPALK